MTKLDKYEDVTIDFESLVEKMDRSKKISKITINELKDMIIRFKKFENISLPDKVPESESAYLTKIECMILELEEIHTALTKTSKLDIKIDGDEKISLSKLKRDALEQVIKIVEEYR